MSLLALPVQTVEDERVLIVDTPEESDVDEVVLERLKINGVRVQVCQDPALIFCHHPWKVSLFLKLLSRSHESLVITDLLSLVQDVPENVSLTSKDDVPCFDIS